MVDDGGAAVNITLKTTVAPLDLGTIIDKRGMTTLGNTVVALIRRRTQQGIDADGDRFIPYSTRPIYISRSRGTGARLAPKGGRPSRTGASVYYAGGYAEYKRLSTGSGDVNLTLSGQLMRSIRVAKASARKVVVQAGGSAIKYAGGVNSRRPFMGVTPDEVGVLEKVLDAEIRRTIREAQEAQREQQR